MNDLLNWWFDWGAIIFLVTTLLIAMLVLFDIIRRRAGGAGWLAGVSLPVLLILPSVILKLDLQGVSDNVQKGLFWIGAISGLVAVIVAIGYFMLSSAQPARRRVSGSVGGGYPPPYWNQPVNVPAGNPAVPPTNFNSGGNGAAGSAGPMPNGPPAPGLLVLQRGPGAPRQHQLHAGRTTIGRNPQTSAILIDDQDVSREHAYVVYQSGRFKLGDVGSKNGTSLNGQRLRGDAWLADNDVISLGPSVQLLFKQL